MTIKHKIINIIIPFYSTFLFSNEVEVNNYNTFLQSEKYSKDISKAVCDSILGTYVLESCENSRFKIVLNKINKQYSYIILDRKKTIAKGKAKLTKNKEYTSIMLGLIGGIFSGKDIQIQNYGNAMNEFIHFTQCDEKYLTFVKK
jgi:hypothetical protein